MTVADVDGIKIAGVIFDAGVNNSPVLLEVGPTGSSANHSSNPATLSDLTFRVGGAAVGKADVSLKINSNNVIGDNFWAWRADHGAAGAVGWTINTANTGIEVPSAIDDSVHHACSVFLTGNGEITHVVNNLGAAAKVGSVRQIVTDK